jgi:hypothetical protein
MLAWITWRCGSFALGDRLSLPRRWPPLQTRIAETKQTRRPVPVHNCSVRLSDVDVDPRVRIRPFDLRDLPLQRHCLGRIELARDGVMGDERLTSAEDDDGDQDERDGRPHGDSSCALRIDDRNRDRADTLDYFAVKK